MASAAGSELATACCNARVVSTHIGGVTFRECERCGRVIEA